MQKAFFTVLLCIIILTFTSCTTTEKDDPEPQKIPGANYLKGKSVSAGANSTIVLRENGTIKTLVAGQIEDSLTGVISVSSGMGHEICLKSDGTVFTWGSNYNGELGDITNIHRFTPKQVAGLNNIVAVAAGGAHSLALTADGTVWAWGENATGQLGDSTKVDKNYPVKVKGLTNVIFIAASTSHSLAIKSDGTVWGWGYNAEGNLGNGEGIILIPSEISGLSNSIAVGAGYNYTIALKSDGTVWACGTNIAGQLGIGIFSAGSSTPVQIVSLSEIRAISVGHTHSLVIKSDSTVWGWGYNASGSIGDGTDIRRNAPVKVDYIKGIKYIEAGTGYHSAAIEADGTVWTWGNNTAFQLGIPFGASARYYPDRVKE